MERCTECRGAGLRRWRGGAQAPCYCVYRAIFRACYARFRYCVEKEKYLSKVSLVACQGSDRRRTYERLVEDYIADFCLVSRRFLEPRQHRIFRYHYLLGADWRLCCRQLRLGRGLFFHEVYRIQQRLGRVFRELEPYGLYPLDEYFAGRVNGQAPVRPAVAVCPIRKGLPVRPPLKRAA